MLFILLLYESCTITKWNIGFDKHGPESELKGSKVDFSWSLCMDLVPCNYRQSSMSVYVTHLSHFVVYFIVIWYHPSVDDPFFAILLQTNCHQQLKLSSRIISGHNSCYLVACGTCQLINFVLGIFHLLCIFSVDQC